MAWSNVGNIRGPSGVNGADGAGSAYPATAAGFKTWTTDPVALTADYNVGSGLLLLSRVHFPRTQEIETLHCLLTGTGTGDEVGTSGMALYADDGLLLSASADDLVAFVFGPPGRRSFDLTDPQPVTAGAHGWLALLFGGNGTAPKSPATPTSLAEEVINVGARRSVYLTGQSDFPASVNIAAATVNNGVFWMAAS